MSYVVRIVEIRPQCDHKLKCLGFYDLKETLLVGQSDVCNINKSQTSLCPTNNVFLFGQKEIISVSTTPGNIMTSYKSPIFFLIVTIFSSIFYKEKSF